MEIITAVEPGDLAAALPKFDIVPVDKLPRLFLGILVVCTIERNRLSKMAVRADDVDPIIGHGFLARRQFETA